LGIRGKSLLCDDDEIEPVPEKSNKEIIIAELQLYSTLKIFFIDDHSCPLLFYKMNEQKLPNMAKISKRLFRITASSVPSECVFSK
jgi:hypothetical protein